MVAEPSKLGFEYYLAFAGAGLVLLAVILYFFRGGKLQVPAIVTSGIGCLAVGLALGILSMAAFGYHWERETTTGREGPVQAPPGARAGGGGGMGAGGMPAKPGGGGGFGGGGPGGGGGGGRDARGPGAPRQLAGLVAKLEQLSGKPLALELNAEQRQKIAEQIQGLKEMNELNEDEAKKRFDALIAVLEPHRVVLESAGFRWPGATSGGPLGEIPNPFREDNNAQALESLQGRMKDSAKKQP